MEHLQALRQGAKLAFNSAGKSAAMMGSVRAHFKWQVSPVNFSDTMIFITDVQQLHDVVTKIPELAWDILDYATDPMVLFLDHAKEGLPRSQKHDNLLGIMIVREGELYRWINKLGSAIQVWWADDRGFILSEGDISLTLPDKLFPSIDNVKKMWLGLDGEVKIF